MSSNPTLVRFRSCSISVHSCTSEASPRQEKTDSFTTKSSIEERGIDIILNKYLFSQSPVTSFGQGNVSYVSLPSGGSEKPKYDSLVSLFPAQETACSRWHLYEMVEP